MTYIEFHGAIIKIDHHLDLRIESNTGCFGEDLLFGMIVSEARNVLVASPAPDYDLAALLVQRYPSACRVVYHRSTRFSRPGTPDAPA